MIGNRLSALLALLLVACGAFAVWQLRAAATPAAAVPAAVAPALALRPAPAPAPLDVPALEELSHTLQRPLFSQTRRPAPVEAAPTDASLPATAAVNLAPLSVELSAVILDLDRQFALFRQLALGTMIKAELGQDVDGWVLSEIRSDGVTLERGTERQDLALRTFKAAPVRNGAAAPPPMRATLPQPANARDASPAPAIEARRPRRPLRGPRRRSIQRQQPGTATQ